MTAEFKKMSKNVLKTLDRNRQTDTIVIGGGGSQFAGSALANHPHRMREHLCQNLPFLGYAPKR